MYFPTYLTFSYQPYLSYSPFLSIDTNILLQENHLPVPLKHSTETAYLLFLGLAICIAGVAAALLPPIPAGTTYWAILLAISVLYPLVLSRTFKSNRADYEFRVLHWFPAGIFILWFVLQLLSPRIDMIRIFALGFFFLWSLPLVALGIAFIIIFAIHVLRRSRVRVTSLLVFLVLFTAGALYAEAAGVNPRLQAALFPKNAPTFASVRTTFANLRASLGFWVDSSGVLVATNTSSSSSMSVSSKVSSSIASISSSRPPVAVLPPVIGDKNPGHLAQSGPESMAVLGATLFAAYFGLLHARAKQRV